MMRQLGFVLFLVFFISNSLLAQRTDFIYVENGRLYHPDGREVALYGVNLSSSQTALYKVEDDGTNTFVKNINPKSFAVSPGIYMIKNYMITGIDKLNLNDELNIYPNPTTQKLHIVNGFNGHLTILSLDGRKVFSTPYRLGDTINLSTINSGVYVLVLSGDYNVSTKKFIKIR